MPPEIVCNQPRAARQGTSYAEFPCLLCSGEHRWLAHSPSPAMDGDRIVGFHLGVRDVSADQLMQWSLACGSRPFIVAVAGAQ